MRIMDTRNVQTVEIERLNKRIAEDRQMLRLQDDSINNLLRICRGNDAAIDELKSKLAGREKQFDELDGVLDRTRELLHAAMDRIQVQNDEIAKKDGWISSYSKNDKRLNRLLDELLVDARKRDKAINEHKEHIDKMNQEINMSEDDALDTIESIWSIIKDWAREPSCNSKKTIEDIVLSIQSSRRRSR